MGSRAKISPPSPGDRVHTFILHGVGMLLCNAFFSSSTCIQHVGATHLPMDSTVDHKYRSLESTMK